MTFTSGRRKCWQFTASRGACMHARMEFVSGRKYKAILVRTMPGCSCQVEANKTVIRHVR
jgi:hypothetical protein